MKLPQSIIFLTILLASPLCTYAKVTNPNIYINEYNKLAKETGETAKTYDFVMAVYNEYILALDNNDNPYSDKQVAVAGLKWLFPYLMDGAFYYSAHNDQAKALICAEAYIDTYILLR